ncbi:MAG: flagellar hook-basal body complex protein, partial [Planctomycetota bacterium]|nr:flagellar hook-basal body complex protein [Planctomycetota bacterium]
GENRVRISIYAAVDQTGGDVSSQGIVQEIPVEIVFFGPTASPDGSLNEFAWSMTTIGWPNPGDSPVTIYPTAAGGAASLPAASFYVSGSLNPSRGAGQAASSLIRPGSTTVEITTTSPDGASITTSFKLTDSLTLDVSRLSNLQRDAPGGNALEAWHVNGNPKGSIARTITVYDEYTAFIEGTDAAGNSVVLPERRVQAREDTLFFSKVSADGAGSEWAWRSSLDNASGTLQFNTSGELVSATQPEGGIDYDFSGISNINYAGFLQAAAQDGYVDGTLDNISIDQNGKIFGHYSNNVSDILAMLALGTVPNPSGLEGRSGTLFYPGAVSDALMVGVAGDADAAFGIPAIGAGLLTSGYLENSNVALSEEFTGLISIERGYQLNSRVVTTSDEMLQTALQMKR